MSVHGTARGTYQVVAKGPNEGELLAFEDTNGDGRWDERTEWLGVMGPSSTKERPFLREASEAEKNQAKQVGESSHANPSPPQERPEKTVRFQPPSNASSNLKILKLRESVPIRPQAPVNQMNLEVGNLLEPFFTSPGQGPRRFDPYYELFNKNPKQGELYAQACQQAIEQLCQQANRIPVTDPIRRTCAGEIDVPIDTSVPLERHGTPYDMIGALTSIKVSLEALIQHRSDTAIQKLGTSVGQYSVFKNGLEPYCPNSGDGGGVGVPVTENAEQSAADAKSPARSFALSAALLVVAAVLRLPPPGSLGVASGEMPSSTEASKSATSSVGIVALGTGILLFVCGLVTGGAAAAFAFVPENIGDSGASLAQ